MFLRRNTPEPVSRPKNCLNCSVAVPPENVFCGQCGQENEASPVSFAALMGEVWDEFVKIDSKLLRTLWRLVASPGYLSTEFVRGRRTAYLSPFRMYIGVSALFFFLFGVMVPFDRIDGWEGKMDAAEQKTQAAIQKANAEKARQKKSDSKPVRVDVKGNGVNISGTVESDQKMLNDWRKIRHRPITIMGYPIPMDSLPESVSAYRDDQDSKPRSKRDGPALHYAKERLIHFKSEPGDTVKSLVSTALPLILLIQLPLAAIWLRILYLRQKRLYVEHLVFLLHTHTLYLLMFGLMLAPEAVMRSLGGHLTVFDSPAPWLWITAIIMVHNLIAMRRFYGQSWGKTLVKSWFFANGYWFQFIFTVVISLSMAIMWTMLAPG